MTTAGITRQLRHKDVPNVSSCLLVFITQHVFRRYAASHQTYHLKINP